MRGLATVGLLAVALWVVGVGLGLAGGAVLRSERRSTPVATVRIERLTREPTPEVTGAAVPVRPTPANGVIGTPERRLTRLRIPAIGVDAPIVVKGLDADRRMEAPDTPNTVAWYDFSALPGEGRNIVLAGHVDFAGVGPAVFWDLWRVRPGDVVELELADGKAVRYQVSGVETVDEARAPVEAIVGAGTEERVTLITCAGNYNPATGRYDQRLIVTARPIGERPASG